MSDYFEDSDLLSEDYKKRDDDLDDDLVDDDQLLYSSEEEKDGTYSSSSLVPSQPNLPSIQTEKNSHFSEALNEFQTIEKNQLPSVNESDSEGTDTRDETDDRPLNGDDPARMKIKIFRNISTTSNDLNELETNLQENIPTVPETISQAGADASIHFDDEDSDGDEKSARGRFRSERDVKSINLNINRRNSEKRDIPDTLEISQEEQQKIEEFNKQQKERRFPKRTRGKPNTRGFNNQPRFSMRLGRGNPPHSMNMHGARTHGPNMSTYQRNSPHQPKSLLGAPPPNLLPLMNQRHPPPFPFNIPPPNHWPGSRNIPPPIVPVRPMVSMPQILLPSQPPAVAMNIPPPQNVLVSNPPISTTNLAADNNAPNINTESHGIPIPTVMSLGKRETSEDLTKPIELRTKRQALFDSQDRSSPKLSVKISRSRSPSPFPRNSKRLVIKPRRSRSRSPKPTKSRRREKSPRKRSRRRSRSYSPRRRSRSRSYSPKRRSPSPPRKSAQNPSRTGKILINPHFKGARSIPTCLATPSSTSSSTVTSLINPLLLSFPPPLLPGVVNPPTTVPPININVPPPQLPSTAVTASAPTIAAPPPVMPSPIAVPPPIDPTKPPPSITSIPPTLAVTTPTVTSTTGVRLPTTAILPPRSNVPPPTLPPPGGAPVQPPAAANRPHLEILQPPPIDMTRPPPVDMSHPPPVDMSRPPPVDITRPPPSMLLPNVANTPPGMQNMNQPRGQRFSSGRPGSDARDGGLTVHIRSTLNEKRPMNVGNVVGKPYLPARRGSRTESRSNLQGEKLTSSQARSRLKPPPGTNKRQSSATQKDWPKDPSITTDYENRMKQQAEKRREILALKARRRGKGDSHSPITAVIRGSNQSESRSVRIGNLALVTKQDTVVKLMKKVGPVEAIKFNSDEKCFVGTFRSPLHAKEFTQRYNRSDVIGSYEGCDWFI